MFVTSLTPCETIVLPTVSEKVMSKSVTIPPKTQPINFLFENIGFTVQSPFHYFFINSGFAKIFPVPNATQSNGSFATKAGTWV